MGILTGSRKFEKSSSHWEGLLYVIHFNVNIVYGLWEIEENKMDSKQSVSFLN